MSLKDLSTEELEKELKRRKQEKEVKPKQKRYNINFINCSNAHDAGSTVADDLEEAKKLAQANEGYYEATVYDRQNEEYVFIVIPQLDYVARNLVKGACPVCNQGIVYEDCEGVSYRTEPCINCYPIKDMVGKLTYLVYWQDVIPDSNGGGAFQRDHIICTSKETCDAEMERMTKAHIEKCFGNDPKYVWTPNVSESTGDKEGAQFKIVNVIKLSWI